MRYGGLPVSGIPTTIDVDGDVRTSIQLQDE